VSAPSDEHLLADEEPLAAEDFPVAPAPPPLPVLSRHEQRALWLEIGVVIAIGVFPHLLSSVVGLLAPEEPTSRGSLAELHLAGYCLPTIIAVLWIMSRSGRPWSEFGVVRPRPSADTFLTLCIALICWLSSYGGAIIIAAACGIIPYLWNLVTLLPAPESAVYQRPVGLGHTVAFITANLANAAAEELVLRGYLIPRLRTALRGAWKAVLLSSMLGASYHIYQGSHSTLIILFGECLVGALFLVAPRLWPFIIGHALYDIVLIAVYYPPST
jgi:membrane protease YdiL (CAAX protease family)